MLLLNRLWRDESGVVLSAEAVLIGTVGLVGAVAGLSTIGHAVNDELKDAGMAIRSLDQSYGYCGHHSRGAWTAGSCFTQQDVQTAIADLGAKVEADTQAIRDRIPALQEQRPDALQELPGNNGEPAPAPNDLPKRESAPLKPKTRAPL